jgi:hypothetical protein
MNLGVLAPRSYIYVVKSMLLVINIHPVDNATGCGRNLSQWSVHTRSTLLSVSLGLCGELCASFWNLFRHFVTTDGRSRGSSVSVVSEYELDDRAIGVRSSAGAKDFSSNLCIQTVYEAHPASCTVGTGVLSLR